MPACPLRAWVECGQGGSVPRLWVQERRQGRLSGRARTALQAQRVYVAATTAAPAGKLRKQAPQPPLQDSGEVGAVPVTTKWELRAESLRRRCEEAELPEAVQALELLVRQGCPVGQSLFYRVLKRCTTGQKDLALGRRVHALAAQSGYESDSFVANHIIVMYAAHGKLEEASRIFAKVAQPSAYTWASIISAHARHGQPGEAIQLYRRMRESAVRPDNHLFMAVLQACGSAADLESGKEVHDHIRRSGLEPDMFLENGLVDMYAKCGSLVDAGRVFDGLRSRNVVTWTALISGYAQHGLGQEALALYGRMLQEGITPSTVTFVSLLKACARIKDLHRGRQLHEHIQDRGLEANVVLGNCLVDMYAKCGSLEEARRVFDTLAARSVVSWTVMISGYAVHGRGQDALDLYRGMQQEGTVVPDSVTFVCLLKACSNVGALQEGKQLHTQIQERGLEADVIVGSCLVDMYVKCGNVEEAKRVFDGLPSKNLVTWTAMIAGYANHGLGKDALDLYAKMQEDGLTPADHVTFTSLLQACASSGALRQGMKLHRQVEERGLEGDVVVGSCLVDMYVKCGKLEEARSVFDRLGTRDVVAWTALLNGYAEHGYGLKAVECFEEMRQQGVRPNGATFSCLFVACSNAGLVLEGQKYFRLMVEDYGIVPDAYHCSGIVDMFARSGFLDQAEAMLCSMPVQADVAAWTSLLSACKTQGDVERGQRCFDRLMSLEPGNGSAYVLLGNIYGNAGRWKDVDRLESLRKFAGADKKAAKACIEVNNKVHEFIVGEDKSDVSSKVKSVNSRLKSEGGHVPHTELVLTGIPEQDKEDALCGHAEKLALAFGLLNTPDGTTLVVTKNLRMCNDCHSSTKIMSHVERREIVVRDSHGVHQFRNGACSCGDRQ